jgi:hypothetical protein
MNRHHLLSLLIATATTTVLAQPAAAARATPPEAEALVARAVAYLQVHGPQKAYAAFTQGSAFRDRELYVVVYDLNGRNLAHGANPALVGGDLVQSGADDGQPLNRTLVDLARRQGRGWSTAFGLRNPVSNDLQRRSMYVERVGDVLVGAGVVLD